MWVIVHLPLSSAVGTAVQLCRHSPEKIGMETGCCLERKLYFSPFSACLSHSLAFAVVY